ncbi:hypothetical protein F5883DRAFT_40366 [Diaporthe sp. PMI_573]|nr:hypothetical protein F5883DRAFT_40366 [Diaporthaceae sp. PMI_573]
MYSRAEPTHEHENSSEPSVLGYLHLSSAFERRQRPQSRSRSRPAEHLFWTSLFREKQEGRYKGLYLMCVLLSIAQYHSSGMSTSQRLSAGLLVTEASDPNAIYLYEAEFCPEILDILDNPTIHLKETIWPTIRRKTVPFEPLGTFKKRLLAILPTCDLIRH